MALPLGKLSLIVGAGLVESVLAKEGRISNVSDFFSGAFKIVFKQLKQDGPTTSQPKPRNDLLMQKVNSLREELQLLGLRKLGDYFERVARERGIATKNGSAATTRSKSSKANFSSEEEEQRGKKKLVKRVMKIGGVVVATAAGIKSSPRFSRMC